MFCMCCWYVYVILLNVHALLFFDPLSIIVIYHFYIAQQTPCTHVACDSECVTILSAHFINIHQSGVLTLSLRQCYFSSWCYIRIFTH